MLDIRKSLPSAEVNEASVEICEAVRQLDIFKSAKKIATYAACNGEINPSFLEPCADKKFLLPVVQENGLLEFMEPHGDLRKGRFGILEPVTGIVEKISEIDLVFVP